MTKNERDFIVSTIAASTREVSTEAFVELNSLLHKSSVDKTCNNCKLQKDMDCSVFDIGYSVNDDFGCNEFIRRDDD